MFPINHERTASTPTASVTFKDNVDSTYISYCHSEGAILYTLNPKATNPEPFAQIEDYPGVDIPNVLIAERIDNKNNGFLVLGQFPTVLSVFNLKTKSKVHDIDFKEQIKSIRHNKKVLAVCLSDQIHIFSIDSLEKLHVIEISRFNVRGLFDMCPADRSLIVHPTLVPGQVGFFDADNLQEGPVHRVHLTALTMMKLNRDGTLLATASRKGTVIRVMDTGTQTVIYNFCRSLVREAKIYSFAFSADNKYLVSSSETGTVHLFELKDSGSAIANISTNMGIGTVGNYLSHYCPELVKQAEQFIPESMSRPKSISVCTVDAEIENSVAVFVIDETPVVFVGLCDGNIDIFRYNGTSECEHLTRVRLGQFKPLRERRSNDPGSLTTHL
uniref:WD_REPEATS_REGION domain-containing protein n=1 Tax=Steinernema glaseri TaxID=37863 RepID=A0A1I7YUB8_9BILA